MQVMLHTDSTMKSFCIFGVLLLTVVKLKAASVSESTCEVRNLTVTVDDYLRLYFDGVEITDLPNAGDWRYPDVVDLPCTTKLIAIHGNNVRKMAGILASTDDEYVLTNSSWKCSNVSQLGWEEIEFDDSNWMSAIEYLRNNESSSIYEPMISTNAFSLWLRQWNGNENSTYEHMDLDVYCRKRLDIDACNSNPCLNSGTCNNFGGESFTCTCPIYATGVKCESPNYNEAFTCGTMLTWSRYNASNDFTRLCYFWTPLDDTNGRFTECRNVIQGLPLYDDYNGLLNAGGNFGCLVSQDYPDDLPATSYLSCADDYQQDIHLGNVTESDRLMICIRYPYEGLPDKEQH